MDQQPFSPQSPAAASAAGTTVPTGGPAGPTAPGPLLDPRRAAAEFQIPEFLDPWLARVLREAVRETQILRANGAHPPADARDELLRRLLAAAADYHDEAIDTREMAALLGCGEETARRKIRGGAIPDRRGGKRGPHAVRRGDVLAVVKRPKGEYCAVADAQDIAQRRRKA